MIVLQCPRCGANLEVDENRDFAFCSYCGVKIINIQNRVVINGIPELRNLIIRAQEFAQKGDYARAQEYCTRILDLDPYNTAARAIEASLPHAAPTIPETNVCLFYESELNAKYRLRYSLDCRNWSELGPGERVALKLPVGRNMIWFIGTKNYTFSIDITNAYQQRTVTYSAKRRGGNTITCI